MSANDRIEIVVNFRGDTYHARAGAGKAAKLASSTSGALFAAAAAARKYFRGLESNVFQINEGSCSDRKPWIYYAQRVNTEPCTTPAASGDQLKTALAACRSIRFAGTNALRHGGEYSLNDLIAADRLAREALEMDPATKGGGR